MNQVISSRRPNKHLHASKIQKATEETGGRKKRQMSTLQTNADEQKIEAFWST